MNAPTYRAISLKTGLYIEGYYISQKDPITKCLKCNSLNTEGWDVNGFSYCTCYSCGFESSFDDDMFEHAHTGKERHYIIDSANNKTEIDQETLSIHFPDMLDENKNPIFSSLREDGKGSDLLIDDLDMEYYCYYEIGAFYLKNLDYDTLDDELAIPPEGLKVKGKYKEYNENK